MNGDEECDDGNENDEDDCANDCTENDVPPPPSCCPFCVQYSCDSGCNAECCEGLSDNGFCSN